MVFSFRMDGFDSIKNHLKEDLNNPMKPATFHKTENYTGKILNGIEFKPVAMPKLPDIKDVDLNEPEFSLATNERHLRQSSGVIMIEADGRVWVYEPKNHFGGYEHTFPKGRIEVGLTLQQTAIKRMEDEFIYMD